MYRPRICNQCQEQFTGWWNAKYCPTCKPIQRQQKDRDRRERIKGAPIAEGQWRCPDCGCFKDRHADKCANCFNNAKRGDHNVNWKGGKSRATSGHIIILKPEGYAEANKHRYVLEHRYIWEQAHGPLPKGTIIHHLNGVKDDNRLENLAALSRTAHSGSAVLHVFKDRIRILEERLQQQRFCCVDEHNNHHPS